MFQIKNFIGSNPDNPDNKNIRILDRRGAFSIVEYQRDLSVSRSSAEEEYYAFRMGVRKKQLVCNLAACNITLQAGAMQWMVGNCQLKTGVKSAGDFVGKLFTGCVTGESAVKPEYAGTGIVTCEPTYKHLILTSPSEWNGSVVIDDGMFLACESTVRQSIQKRKNFSSAVAGGKGLFNLQLSEGGAVCLESDYPKAELVEIELQDDELRVDGSFVIAWSGSLEFTVESATGSLVGSAASGEGLVNVYRGTGRLWMMPVA